ncbi:UNVERIFIED_ORG: hypothetical protein GGI62_003344 [Rhizobium esperanzae]
MMNRPPGISRVSSCRPHVLTNSEHQLFERVRRHKRLLAIISSSRAQFEREVQSRRRLLAALEPPPAADPLNAVIEEAWRRLSAHYHKFRKLNHYPDRKWRHGR